METFKLSGALLNKLDHIRDQLCATYTPAELEAAGPAIMMAGCNCGGGCKGGCTGRCGGCGGSSCKGGMKIF